MSWGTPYGEDYGEESVWAADWAKQLAPSAPPSQRSPWYSSDYAYNPTYGQNFQYLPRMTTGSEPYRPVSTYTSQILNQMADEYARKTYPENYQPMSVTGPTTANPMASPTEPLWKAVNAWDPFIHQDIAQVAGETGVNVPGNVIKAIMMIESQGNPNARNGNAVGPLQVTPDTIGAQAKENGWDYSKAASDPNYAVYAGIKELALRYLDARKTNPSYGWGNVANGYFSNSYEIVPKSDSTGTTVAEYNDRFTNYLNYLDKLSAPQAGQGGYSAPKGTTEFTSIWGGTDTPITQEFGPTDFGMQHANDWYAYVTKYGLQAGSHAGVDVGVNEGTRLYSPVAGKVTISGGQPFYTDSKMTPAGATSQNGTGELMIELANGDQLILGHMNTIGVHVGDTVAPGQLVGVSGYNNGAHVHVEYRHLTPGKTESGYTIIDPRNALSGSYTGQFLGADQPGYGGTTTPNGNNWQDILAAAAQGRPLALGENEYQPTGTFRDYVLQVMGIYKPQEAAQATPQGTTQFTGGTLSNAGQTSFGNWSTLDQQNANINAAVARVQKELGITVPANLVKGVMAREGSYGADWVPGGQAMPTRPGELIEPWNGLTRGAVQGWKLDWNQASTNQAYSIYAQAYIMASLYKQYSQYGWDGTMTAYLTGSPTRASDPEGVTKTSDYLYGPNGVLNHWHRLDQLAAQKK
jgi:murein DD-endopeptidase MepM/ murein hydrolase activator NlpD